MDRGKVHLATLGALFHDIGKFYRLAQGNPDGPGHAELSAEFLEEARFLGEKRRGERVSVREKLKALFNLEDRDFELLKEAVRRHHDGNPDRGENPLAFIVQKADCLSSGLSSPPAGQDEEPLYRTLVPPFALIKIDGRGDAPYPAQDWGYRFKELSVASAFPVEKVSENYSEEERRRDYRELWDAFLENFTKLPEKGDFNFRLEALKALLIRFTWAVPSFSYPGGEGSPSIPDVSLAHHLLTASAVATALWRFVEEDGLKDKERAKFILLSVDFSGIQSFIFSPPRDTKKWAAKILRARSFVISLAIESVVREILEEFGVNTSCVVMNSGGKAWLLLPALSDRRERIERVRRRVVEELLSEKKNFFGEIKLKISWIELEEEDFALGRFEEALRRLAEEEARNRYRLFTPEDFDRLIIEGYAEEFSGPDRELCSICGKAPGEKEPGQELYKCKLCSYLVDIGARLPGSAGALITYRSSHFPIPHVRPLKAGEVEEALASLGEGQMLYSFSLNPGLPLPVKPLENYIPQVGRDESEGEMAGLIRECYEEGPELREGLPKNFCHIALHALERRGSSLCGRPYLGVLKADVDNLGYIFSRGFIKVNGSSILSLSRLVSLSWFLDLFFSEVLKSYIEEEERFRNIYSVFSGGDDLFLIGPWSRILEFEPLLREKFSEYTCENRSFTISAGIAVVRPELPIYYMAEEAEGALDVSKEGGKNATTVFSKRIAYPEFSLKELLEVADWLTGKIGGWCDGEGAQRGSGSLLYKLLTISEMANREGEEPGNMLWRAYLKYLIYRRSGSSEEERKEAQELFKKLEGLIRKYSEEISEGSGRKKDNLFYIPLAIAIYRRRKYGKGED